MRAKPLVTAGIALVAASALFTVNGIEDRAQRARASLTPTRLSALHQGGGRCLRWAEAGPSTEARAVADALVAARLGDRAPELLAVAWRWARDAEARAHAQTPREEVRASFLEALSAIDALWFRALGEARLGELGPEPAPPELEAYAARAEARLTPNELDSLKKIWSDRPEVFARARESGLLEALGISDAAR